VEIRGPVEGDVETILRVYKECEDFLALGPQPAATPDMVAQDLALSRAEGGTFCLVTDLDGRAIGVVDFVPSGADGRPEHAFLSLLMIAAPHRGRGLGREIVALVEQEIEHDPAVTAILSGVQVNNPAAIRFWQRNGYQITGGPELLPDATTVYHLRKELAPRYFAHLTPTGDPAADVCRFYEAAGRADTLAHVMQVAAQGRALAELHGLSAPAAGLAALAHDLAAVVPVSERVGIAERMGVPVSDADRALPALLHGPIAAAALAEKLGVRDAALLAAVRYHSTLRAGAGPLEKVVFLADKIAYDPRSPHHGEYLPALQAARSLDEAVLVYLDFVLDNTWRYGWYLHPDAVAAYRELSRGGKR
jgi:predicted HD superfamily hydrolase involved in NAD metabolism